MSGRMRSRPVGDLLLALCSWSTDEMRDSSPAPVYQSQLAFCSPNNGQSRRGLASAILKKQCRFSMNFEAENNEQLVVGSLSTHEEETFDSCERRRGKVMLLFCFFHPMEKHKFSCELASPTPGLSVPSSSPRPLCFLLQLDK